MENSAMLQSSPKATGSALENLVNRLFRCRHRRKTFPFTPKGEDQCYAVCLDCGQRLGADLQVMEPDTAETAAPGPVANNSSWSDPDLRHWLYDLLWVGLFAVGLSGGLYFSGQI